MIKALVVDDEYENRAMLGELLGHLGCDTMLAQDGIECEQFAFDWHPQLILLDIMMPKQDGYQTCTALRSRGYKGQIIMVSSLTQGLAAAQALTAGANAFFMKPLTIDVLQGCINKASI